MKKVPSIIKSTGERGVAILFAILLTSVLLLVAVSIAGVSYKELTFSAEARDSDSAFYAADTGIECALLLDTAGAFASSASGTASCGGTSSFVVSGSYPTFNFSMPFTGTCAQIYIDKEYSSGAETEIRSFGYSVPQNSSASCVGTTVPARVVTRALRVHYPNP